MLHYKKLYSAECKRCGILEKETLKLRNEISTLQSQLGNTGKSIDICSNLPLSRKRKLKEWDKITNEHTKRRHFCNYKDILFESLCKISVCHRAEVTLWMCSNCVQFSWLPKGFKKKTTILHVLQKQNTDDNSYASNNVTIDDENEEFEDVDYSDIYDMNGNWQRRHIRHLVHVLDTFRISHEAYHELRMVSKGHLPPIHRLRSEKRKMSEEIPYIKIGNVSFPFKNTFCWRK